VSAAKAFAPWLSEVGRGRNSVTRGSWRVAGGSPPSSGRARPAVGSAAKALPAQLEGRWRGTCAASQPPNPPSSSSLQPPTPTRRGCGAGRGLAESVGATAKPVGVPGGFPAEVLPRGGARSVRLALRGAEEKELRVEVAAGLENPLV